MRAASIYNVGCEAEYFLVRRLPEGGIEVADPLDRSAAPCYDAKGLTRMFDHLTTVSKYVNRLGWANYANDHEDANGQFEQNFAYADALTSADRLIFFRYMVHMVAHQAGLAATFMPKPFANLTGSGLHLHSSLWDDASGAELFADPGDARGLGLSEMAYHYIGGLIEHGPAMAAVTCPTVNSYKRIGVGAPVSGATWAPAYATYGGNNRTQMLRVPDGGRVENRACDGSANPYLAMAVQLAAGLDGIDRGLDPGEPNRDNLHLMSAEEVARRGIRTHAADPAARSGRAGRRRRAARRARQDAGRGLRRLLRTGQARGVPRLALRRERLGGRALPDALLERLTRPSGSGETETE